MIIEVITGGKKHTIEAQPGDNLAKCLVEAGHMEGTECGRGVCGKCAVKLVSGILESMGAEGENVLEHLPGHYLACMSRLGNDGVVIEVAAARDDIQRKVRLPNFACNTRDGEPIVRKKFLDMSPPSLEDQRSDMERVMQALGGKYAVQHHVLAHLPSLLRKSDFKVTAVLAGNEVIDIESGDTTDQIYGFVADIGTTTVAIYLVNMQSGEAVDAEGLANPQRTYGADVLSRISACKGDNELAKMQNLVIEGISQAFGKLLKRNSVNRENVYGVVVVGNTTMSHLFLGVEPANLAVAPFIPCYRPRIDVPAANLGLPIHPAAHVHVLANISGYVGSDTLGVAMATRPWEQEGFSLAVDIGTNGEILLAGNGEIYACSAAAGPAFEGSHIEMGMRAGEGAIERVRLNENGVELEVIGDVPPKGICGSGLIDAVAELLRMGLLESSGRFVKDGVLDIPLASRLRTGANGVREFVLAYKDEFGNRNDVVITLKDIRELQLAQSAIAAGIEILYKEAGITADKVGRLYLAGAFGNYLDRENAVALGLFPGIDVEKIIPVGNAAAFGAGICLLSRGDLAMSDEVAAAVHPIELSARKDFSDLWVRHMIFPKKAAQK